MGSKGRVPPPFMRRPLPGPGMIHPEPFGPGIRPPARAFPSFDVLPPPEVLEQKVASQQVEMQKLATENQRLAATHGTLRQELAAAQHELQMLHAHIDSVKTEREHHMRGLMDKIARMETDLQTAEPIKTDLQQARADAQSLVAARQELISKGHQLSEALQRANSDVQQIPALMSEMESLRQEYQHCRATYDYEKKLYNDHLESLQVMEKNYMNMAREVEKLRAELTNPTPVDRRTGGPYGVTTGYNESEATGHYRVGQSAYNDSYNVPQGRVVLPGDGVGPGASGGGGTHIVAQPGSVPVSAGYEASRGSSYDAQRGSGGPGYDTQRGPIGHGFNAQRAPGYDAQKGLGYDGQRGHGYEMQRGAGFDAQRAAGYDIHGGSNYDAQKGPSYDGQRGPGYESLRVQGYEAATRGAYGHQGQVAPVNNAPYGSGTPPNHAASDYDTVARGANPGQK